ncbi:MAG: hypothetical protein ABI615_02240 [Chthoniobacterales bacterium]
MIRKFSLPLFGIALSLLGGSAQAVDIPPDLTPTGGTDNLDYVLTEDGAVIGYGVYTGTFDAATHAVILSGNNDFTGDIVLEGGTLQIGSATALGSSAGEFRVTGSGTLDLNGQSVVSKNTSNSASAIITNTSSSAAS